MLALHLPHAHPWRLTALAALVAVAATVLVLLTSSRLDAGGGSTAPPVASEPAPPAQVEAPAWVHDPLAPPTLEPTAP